MSQLSSLYIDALNASSPALIIAFFGVIIAKLGIYDKKQGALLSSLAFKLCAPFTVMNTISTCVLTKDDFLLILAIILACILSIVLIFPVCYLFPNQKLMAFAAISIILFLNNSIATGIPVFSGLYDPAIVPKYSFIQVIAAQGGLFPCILICFEVASSRREGAMQQSNKKIIFSALIKTVMQPMIIGVAAGMILNQILPNNRYFGFIQVYFQQLSYAVSPYGLLMLGIFVNNNYLESSEQQQQQHLKKGTKIALLFYLQVMRHLILPLLMALICRLLQIQPVLIVELSVSLFAQPTALFSFVVCQQFGFGEDLAGFCAIVGVVTGSLVIPLLQLFVRLLYK